MSQKQKVKNNFIDGLSEKKQEPVSFDLLTYSFVKKYNNRSILFSKKGTTNSFFTQDSKLYWTPEEYRRILRKEKIVRLTKRIDGLNSRQFEKNRIYSNSQSEILYFLIKQRYSSCKNYLKDIAQGSVQGISMVKMWNISVVGAVIFGMFTMTMVYRYLGGSVSAKIEENKKINGQVAGAYTQAGDYQEEDIDPEFMTRLLSDYDKFEKEDDAKKEMEKRIKEMVKGYPIEKMVHEISKQDKIVAALLVAIAKKESAWGVHVPVLNGQDCYNYWGYRGKRDRMGTGGHTCFDSPEDAVNTVAKRIKFLVSNEKLNTPAKMVVWKCGYDCSWDSKAAVQKWISDVDLYFQKLNK